MMIVEILTYLLAPVPLLANFLYAGSFDLRTPVLIAHAAAGAAILMLGLLIRRTRRLNERIDDLRRMMNAAVIHDLKNPMTSVMGCLSFALDNETEEDGRRVLRTRQFTESIDALRKATSGEISSSGKKTIAPVRDCAACALNEDLNAEQRRTLLTLALHGCKEQMALLETLMDSSRLESGEISIRREAIATRGLLDECLDGVRGTASHLGIKLEEDISRSFPAAVYGDRELLPRVMLNLLNNALKYTPAGGTVGLHARVDGGRLRFEVRDTGVGISAEHLGRLFGKYYRVEGRDQSSRRGSGLGLYFCRLVVAAHGGTIRVESAPGKGTSIHFDLPAQG